MATNIQKSNQKEIDDDSDIKMLAISPTTPVTGRRRVTKVTKGNGVIGFACN